MFTLFLTISINNLSKSYPGKQLFKDISFEKKNKILSILNEVIGKNNIDKRKYEFIIRTSFFDDI